MTDASDPGETSGLVFDRRSVLKTGTSLVALSGLSGCSGLSDVDPSQIQSYFFTALPVVLGTSPDAASFEATRRGDDTVTRNPDVGGVGVEVTLTNKYIAYESNVDTLGLLSSPLVDVPVRGPSNPLASDDLRDLLAGPEGQRLLHSTGIVDSPSLAWTDGPTEVNTREGTLLETETTVYSFAGIIEDEGFYLVNLTRVEDDDDAVIAMTVLQRDGQQGPLVGSDGFLTNREVTSSAGRHADILPHVEHSGDIAEVTSKLTIRESTLIDTESGKPSFVRVLAENWSDQRLLGVKLLAHLGSGDTLAVMKSAQVDSLEPGQAVEGYLPHRVDDIDGHLVEGYHSGRERLDSAPDQVSLIRDQMVRAGTVRGTVRNDGGSRAPYVGVRVTFHGNSGAVLGVDTAEIYELGEGQTEDFEASYDPPEATAEVANYNIDLLDESHAARNVH